MYRKCAAAAAGILFLGAGSAWAQEDENWGPYLGVGYGDFSSEFDSVEDVDIDFDEDSDAWKVFGGWRISQWFSVQLDYVDFGESTSTFNLLNIRSQTEGLAPSLVATLPIGPIELFARAGIMFYDVELDLDDDVSVDDSGEDPVYSAGIGLTVIERLNLRAEYEFIDIDEFDEAEAAWVTAAWRF
jgi:hypothetical protein